MTHKNFEQLTSIVRVIALAIILLFLFTWANRMMPSFLPVQSGAARSAIDNAATGAARSCNCNQLTPNKISVPKPYYASEIAKASYVNQQQAPALQDSVLIRVAHAAPGVSTPVTISVDGTEVFRDLVFGDVTSYVPLGTTSATIGIIVEGMQIATIPFKVNKSSAKQLYTIAAVPSASSARTKLPISVKTLNDQTLNIVANTSNNSGVRFYHLSPSAPAVDIYANNQRLFSNVSYGMETSAVVPSGTYQISVVAAGKPLTESNIVYKANTVIEPNKVLSVFAQGVDKLSVATYNSNL